MGLIVAIHADYQIVDRVYRTLIKKQKTTTLDITKAEKQKSDITVAFC